MQASLEIESRLEPTNLVELREPHPPRHLDTGALQRLDDLAVLTAQLGDEVGRRLPLFQHGVRQPDGVIEECAPSPGSSLERKRDTSTVSDVAHRTGRAPELVSDLRGTDPDVETRRNLVSARASRPLCPTDSHDSHPRQRVTPARRAELST